MYITKYWIKILIGYLLRYRHHTSSFRNERYRNATELSTHSTTSNGEKIKHARSYSNTTKKAITLTAFKLAVSVIDFPHGGAWFQATIAVTIECWPVHVYGQSLWIKAIDVNIFFIFIFSMNKLLSVVVTSLDKEFTWAIWTCYWYLSHNTHPPSPFTDHWLLSGRYSY